MEEKSAATPAEEKRPGSSLGGFLLWPIAALVVYLVCLGPFVMLVDRQMLSGRTENVLETIYAPIEWAYESTPLHKPIGMYLHIWSKRFDAKGDQK